MASNDESTLDTQAQSAPQPHPDACFDASWLALRKVADSAARAPELEARAADWLRQRRSAAAPGQPLRLIDLGSGSGANPCHLAPRLPGPQHWTLIDHDAGLLARALTACAGLRDAEGASASVDTHCLDLGRIDASTLAGTDLVCASALLDLVDTAWLDQLADACATTGSALLVTLSVDGTWRFLPDAAATKAALAIAAADDDFVRTAFNAHQRRDKGLGAALGPDAASTLATRLEERGFQVRLMPSPWRLRLDQPAHAALALALIDGWRDAASAQQPDECARIAAWHARRITDCDHDRGRDGGPGGGALEVGHLDLFATPPRAAPCAD
ncbi:class I SAM-dependent methyltransferase [Thauera sp.]|jgi:hypothetical protein|uniref:class I SAM-dependent methyltransferase n=1 Tax=Thauera sp. TaxID=1905334 RepID=UPI002A366B1C|nr:class I SAM-dependent methyltransferase [Thauera sp.]MDX9886455.1 class I SAM-dependent methyltransferase [Thauera sp.]